MGIKKAIKALEDENEVNSSVSTETKNTEKKVSKKSTASTGTSDALRVPEADKENTLSTGLSNLKETFNKYSNKIVSEQAIKLGYVFPFLRVLNLSKGDYTICKDVKLPTDLDIDYVVKYKNIPFIDIFVSINRADSYVEEIYKKMSSAKGLLGIITNGFSYDFYAISSDSALGKIRFFTFNLNDFDSNDIKTLQKIYYDPILQMSGLLYSAEVQFIKKCFNRYLSKGIDRFVAVYLSKFFKESEEKEGTITRLSNPLEYYKNLICNSSISVNVYTSLSLAYPDVVSKENEILSAVPETLNENTELKEWGTADSSIPFTTKVIATRDEPKIYVSLNESDFYKDLRRNVKVEVIIGGSPKHKFTEADLTYLVKYDKYRLMILNLEDCTCDLTGLKLIAFRIGTNVYDCRTWTQIFACLVDYLHSIGYTSKDIVTQCLSIMKEGKPVYSFTSKPYRKEGICKSKKYKNLYYEKNFNTENAVSLFLNTLEAVNVDPSEVYLVLGYQGKGVKAADVSKFVEDGKLICLEKE